MYEKFLYCRCYGIVREPRDSELNDVCFFSVNRRDGNFANDIDGPKLSLLNATDTIKIWET